MSEEYREEETPDEEPVGDAPSTDADVAGNEAETVEEPVDELEAESFTGSEAGLDEEPVTDEEPEVDKSDLTDDEMRVRIEAILFATEQPLSLRRVAEVLSTTSGRARKIIDALAEEYDTQGRGFGIQEIAGGYQVLTRPEFGGVVQQLFKVNRRHRLSAAALETLAIVAYKQPVIRAEIEDIRGVQAGPLLRSLMDQGLVKIVGRAESLGRPMLYGTTKKFLMYFGLTSPKDLPPVEELQKRQ